MILPPLQIHSKNQLLLTQPLNWGKWIPKLHANQNWVILIGKRKKVNQKKSQLEKSQQEKKSTGKKSIDFFSACSKQAYTRRWLGGETSNFKLSGTRSLNCVFSFFRCNWKRYRAIKTEFGTLILYTSAPDDSDFQVCALARCVFAVIWKVTVRYRRNLGHWYLTYYMSVPVGSEAKRSVA